MHSLFRSFFVAVTLLCAATWASALVPMNQGYQVSGFAAYGTFQTVELACRAYITNKQPAGQTYTLLSNPASATVPNRFDCHIKAVRNSDGVVITADSVFASVDKVAQNMCPLNSTVSGSQCQCNAGYDESGGQCVPHVNQCTAKTGKVGVLSWTEGYTRTPDEGDRQAVGPIISPPAGGEVCDGGCAVSLQMSGPGVQPYVSQSPTANGLYRRSVDYPMLGLGKECTMGTADVGAKKDAPPPDCPGSVGDLGNGKPVCVGTAAKPITPTPLGAAPGSAPIAGNPPAGGKPETGEGSGTGSVGRTPTNGSGDAKGGPAAAGAGGKGGGAGGTAAGAGAGSTGTGEGDDKKPCGAPGQPVCNVKVDETGTPGGTGTAFDAAQKKSDDSFTAQSKAIEDAAKRDTGPAWDFSFQLPTGCTPMQTPIGDFTLDPCRYQGTIHDLMSMVWAAITVFTIIGMVGRTIRGT